MRKLLVALMLIVFNVCIVAPVFASDEYDIKDIAENRDVKMQKMITRVGFKILNANKLDKRVVFNYNTNKVVNAFALYNDKSVNVYKGLLSYCDSENEIAAVIAHEIAHQLDYYEGYSQAIAMTFMPKKYEYKADQIGVDLMVNAGYNPVAMIVVYNKFMGHLGPVTEFFATHPNGSKRMMRVYEHIYIKYPRYLVSNEYKGNMYYQNFLLTSVKNRKKLEAKLKNQDAGFVEVKYE